MIWIPGGKGAGRFAMVPANRDPRNVKKICCMSSCGQTMGNITLSEKHYAHTLLEMLTFAHLDTSDMQVSLGSPLGRGHADIQTLNMQVLVDNLPGHGHTDMHWIYRCQWTAPLDADIRTLDMQVSVDSPPGR